MRKMHELFLKANLFVLSYLLLASIVFFTLSFITGSDYCEGFIDGYERGWCYQRGEACFSPPAPVCPVPEVTEEYTYQCGYDRGFTRGLKDRD